MKINKRSGQKPTKSAFKKARPEAVPSPLAAMNSSGKGVGYDRYYDKLGKKESEALRAKYGWLRE